MLCSFYSESKVIPLWYRKFLHFFRASRPSKRSIFLSPSLWNGGGKIVLPNQRHGPSPLAVDLPVALSLSDWCICLRDCCLCLHDVPHSVWDQSANVDWFTSLCSCLGTNHPSGFILLFSSLILVWNSWGASRHGEQGGTLCLVRFLLKISGQWISLWVRAQSCWFLILGAQWSACWERWTELNWISICCCTWPWWLRSSTWMVQYVRPKILHLSFIKLFNSATMSICRTTTSGSFELFKLNWNTGSWACWNLNLIAEDGFVCILG
jgi:hypothetical protein